MIRVDRRIDKYLGWCDVLSCDDEIQRVAVSVAAERADVGRTYPAVRAAAAHIDLGVVDVDVGGTISSNDARSLKNFSVAPLLPGR